MKLVTCWYITIILSFPVWHITLVTHWSIVMLPLHINLTLVTLKCQWYVNMMLVIHLSTIVTILCHEMTWWHDINDILLHVLPCHTATGHHDLNVLLHWQHTIAHSPESMALWWCISATSHCYSTTEFQCDAVVHWHNFVFWLEVLCYTRWYDHMNVWYLNAAPSWTSAS